LPSKVNLLSLILNVYFIGFQLLSEGKLYSSTSLISNHCIAYRNNLVSRRNVRAYPGTRWGFLRSSGQQCWINWSPELWFGRTKVHWLYRLYHRQAPVHNPIILYNLLLFTCAFKLLELIENPRCIFLGTYCLNTRIWVRNSCYANRTGKSRVIVCHLRAL